MDRGLCVSGSIVQGDLDFFLFRIKFVRCFQLPWHFEFIRTIFSPSMCPFRDSWRRGHTRTLTCHVQRSKEWAPLGRTSTSTASRSKAQGERARANGEDPLSSLTMTWINESTWPLGPRLDAKKISNRWIVPLSSYLINIVQSWIN
jgi:hypothetical protein